MTALKFWILLNEDGTVAEQIIAPSDPTVGEGRQTSWPADRVHEAARRGDLEAEEFVGGEWKPKLDGVEAQALRAVDDARAAAGADSGFEDPVRYAHVRKAAEARAWLLLTPEQREGVDVGLLFLWLQNEAEAAGQTLTDRAVTVLEAARATEARIREIDAAAVMAKAHVRSAQTGPTKRAAATRYRTTQTSLT